MKIPVISSTTLDLTLRDFARSRSVVLGVELGSGAMLVVGIESLSALYRLINSAITGFRRLPPCVQLGVGAAAFAILTNPRCREKLAETWNDTIEAVTSMGPDALTMLGNVGAQYFKAHQVTTQMHAVIQPELPRPRRRSALQYARLICLTNRVPMSALEIEQRMRKDGYATQSKHFARYLRRLMRENKQFAEVTPGMWSLQVA